MVLKLTCVANTGHSFVSIQKVTMLKKQRKIIIKLKLQCNVRSECLYLYMGQRLLLNSIHLIMAHADSYNFQHYFAILPRNLIS